MVPRYHRWRERRRSRAVVDDGRSTSGGRQERADTPGAEDGARKFAEVLRRRGGLSGLRTPPEREAAERVDNE
jgi:hypothetical protein